MDIVSWGASNPGERFTLKVNHDGKVKLEVHNGSVTGNQVVNDGEWHHFAMTMEGISLSGTKFYIDGVLVNNIDLNNVVVDTSPHNEVEISRGDWNNYFNGGMDDIRIWDTDLSATTIENYMYKRVDNNHPDYTHLQMNFTFDGNTSTITDLSPNGNDGTMMGGTVYGRRSSGEHHFDFTPSSIVPDITLHQANYTLNVTQTTENDSILKEPYIAAENVLDPLNGSYASDIVTTYLAYYPKTNTMYDLSGSQTGETVSTNVFQLNNSVVDYYFRSPSNLEIMSLVTPYGVNLDLGMEGVAWYFDVTDFYPVLQGKRGLKMTRGGQWQEDIDIQFLFVHGTPTREVLDIRQIWRVDHVNYVDIHANKYYEPRTINLLPSTQSVKISSAITGHGQEGEFIARQHYLAINNGQHNFQWDVWQACGENPIYPQGGTWIYDRAGWCPGMPTQVEEWDITNYITNNQIEVDYGVASATGDSRYIVSNQIISYGDINFSTDARIVAVESPNDQIAYGRNNPICGNPIITVQNSGSNEITDLTIEYQINDGTIKSHDWTGSMEFLEETSIILPADPGFWNAANNNVINEFKVNIVSVNGAADEYTHNDIYKSSFKATDIVDPEIVVSVKTNSAAHENKYRIEDMEGNIILERNSLSNNTTYNDTVSFVAGCYRFVIEDSGKDGIDFWANNDGKGNMRFSALNGSLIKSFEGDFGTSYIYEFSVTETSSIENQTLYDPSFNVYPIPTDEVINVDIKGNEDGTYTIFNTQGQFIEKGDLQTLKENPTIDVSQWDTAVYFIHFNTPKRSTVRKFIKN